MYLQSADGSGVAEPLTTGTETFVPTSITADGASLLGNSSIPKAWTLFLQPFGKRGPARPLLSSPGSQVFPVASPDMRFIAYQSNESGRSEIWVRPFPNVNERRVQVSTDGGRNPLWPRDGRELFFLDLSGNVMGVSVDSTHAELRASAPVRVVTTSPQYYRGDVSIYDVAPDGARFLMIKEDPTVRPPNTPIVMVLNVFGSQQSQGANGGRVQR
jgi:serine/threonine-protein kinase